jgi:hypothetical protein
VTFPCRTARQTRPHALRRRRGIRGCGYAGVQDSLGPRQHEIVVAKVLIDSFHVWLKDRVEPLCDNFETLFSKQAAHVGLRTFRKISIVLEDNWYLEDIHFGAYCRSEGCSRENVELGLYLERFAKPGDFRPDVQGD